MVKLCASLLLMGSVQLFGQSFPYLNASTANGNEFPVDQDTNIYMFHGNRLVKTDKNFNPIWANTYSGIYAFTRILLSKTGSIYCAGTYSSATTSAFGKINADGSVAWLRTGNFSCTKLMLDRNDDLVVCGSNASFIKLDTNGNVLKFKTFGPTTEDVYLDGFSIVEDSAGYYKFVGVGYQGIGPSRDLAIHYYNDNTDLFTKTERIAHLGVPTDTQFGWKLITSKFSDRFYVQSMISGQSSVHTDIRKFTRSGKLSWWGRFSSFHGTNYSFWGHVEESDNGNLLCSLNSRNLLPSYTTAFMKVDSNGTATSSTSAVSMLYNYPLAYYEGSQMSAPRVMHGNSYYFDVVGHYFPGNPLTVQKFNSSLTYPCSSTVNVIYGSSLAGPSFSILASTPSIQSPTSFTFPAHSPVVTTVSFSVNTNFCTVLEIDELMSNNTAVKMFPNPVREKIHFSETVDDVELFDVNGKKLKNSSGVSFVDVADLPQGIYFIRVKAGKGEFSKKFIKE